MSFSERSVFEWSLASVRLFRYPRSIILRWLGESFGMAPFSPESLEKIKQVLESLGDKKEAAYTLFNEDLVFLTEAMRSFKETLSEQELSDIVASGFTYFSSLTKIPISPIPLKLVDHFPEAYKGYEQSSPFISLPVDTDAGPAGIYLKRDSLSPFLPIQLLTEVMKICLQLGVSRIGEENLPHKFFRLPWFENGTALWLSLKAYYEITGETSLLSKYKNRTLMYDALSPSTELQHFSIICELFISKRFDDALKSYLSVPKNTDWGELLTPLEFVAAKPANEIETFLLDFANQKRIQFILPVEYFLLDAISEGTTIEDLAKKADMPIELLKKTLSLLAARQYIFIDGPNVMLNSKFRDMFTRGLIKPNF